MKKAMMAAMTAVALGAGVAGAQAAAVPDYKKAFEGRESTRWLLDGCYRGADTLVVCTFTVTRPNGSGDWGFYQESYYLIDQANRRVNIAWFAPGASAQRIQVPESSAINPSTWYNVNLPANSPVKFSLGFKFPPQYSTIPVFVLYGDTQLHNIPIAAAGKTATAPTTATIPGYTVTFSNCSVNADSTLNCVANLKKAP